MSLQPVDQRTRRLLIERGHATEPPEHCRPKKGPCRYVDIKQKDGTELPRRFTSMGQKFEINYVDGCFFPFIFAVIES